jgi:hypothetical protein
VLKELKKVIEQDRDFTNKLKALAPALQQVGINLTTEEQQAAPKVSITVEKLEHNTQNTPQHREVREIESE